MATQLIFPAWAQVVLLRKTFPKKGKKKVALKKAKRIRKLMLTASLNVGTEDWFGLMSVMSSHFTIVITLHDCDDNDGVQE